MREVFSFWEILAKAFIIINLDLVVDVVEYSTECELLRTSTKFPWISLISASFTAQGVIRMEV